MGLVIPWLILAVVAVPVLVVGVMRMRRRTVMTDPASEAAQRQELTEQELAEAEAYEAKWRDEDEKRYREERLP